MAEKDLRSSVKCFQRLKYRFPRCFQIILSAGHSEARSCSAAAALLDDEALCPLEFAH